MVITMNAWDIQSLFCQIIGRQLVRNMGLAFAVIALVSLLLIADPIVRLEINILRTCEEL